MTISFGRHFVVRLPRREGAVDQRRGGAGGGRNIGSGLAGGRRSQRGRCRSYRVDHALGQDAGPRVLHAWEAVVRAVEVQQLEEDEILRGQRGILSAVLRPGGRWGRRELPAEHASRRVPVAGAVASNKTDLRCAYEDSVSCDFLCLDLLLKVSEGARPPSLLEPVTPVARAMVEVMPEVEHKKVRRPRVLPEPAAKIPLAKDDAASYVQLVGEGALEGLGKLAREGVTVDDDASVSAEEVLELASERCRWPRPLPIQAPCCLRPSVFAPRVVNATDQGTLAVLEV
eukprot:scaffold11260_cov105-Isochrysis_galbana.AAC.3